MDCLPDFSCLPSSRGWKSAGIHAVRSGRGKQRKYVLGAFTETCSLLFLGTRDRRASERHGTRRNPNHRISR